MVRPPLPPDASPEAGEQILGRWESSIEIHRTGPLERFVTIFTLTDSRFTVWFLPERKEKESWFSMPLTSAGKKRLGEFAAWHRVYDIRLMDVPEPQLEPPPAKPKAHAPHVLIIGEHRIMVMEPETAEAIFATVRSRWRELHAALA